MNQGWKDPKQEMPVLEDGVQSKEVLIAFGDEYDDIMFARRRIKNEREIWWNDTYGEVFDGDFVVAWMYKPRFIGVFG